ncbi:MAG TPA: HAD-IC family P-type ATPase, partial [Candidatus Hodarchaeales archaeon]|nr:HAD-IC family P-type ATPase [Candidatus Hodarchaeales archaeon]
SWAPSELGQDISGLSRGRGNPTEVALLKFAYIVDPRANETKERYQITKEFPFDSSIKKMTKVVQQVSNGERLVLSKGATEVLIESCAFVGTPGASQEMTQTERKRILDQENTLAIQGYRILSFAFRPFQGESVTDNRLQVEKELYYLGFVSLLDPPRPGVRTSVQECKDAGIIPIMITGDSMATATTIAKEIGILQDGHEKVCEGKDMSSLAESDFLETRVFARVSPKDKQISIEKYQSEGHAVSMTGDGVNDALALAMADAGLAMGLNGTDVARQAADLVIADDSFNSIVTGIREGRGLFQRIRIMIYFYVCVNLAEAMIYMGSPLLTAVIPGFELLDTIQRVYIFAIAHSLPPLALIIDRMPSDIMKRKPIDTANIISKKMGLILVMVSITLAFSLYFVYFASYYSIIPINDVNMSFFSPVFKMVPTDLRPIDWSQAKARTMLQTVIYVSESLIIFSLLRIDKSIFRTIKEDSWWFTWLAVFSIWGIHILLMYFPPVQEIIASTKFYLDIIGLSLTDWIICIILGLLPILVLELAKYNNRRTKTYF